MKDIRTRTQKRPDTNVRALINPFLQAKQHFPNGLFHFQNISRRCCIYRKREGHSIKSGFTIEINITSLRILPISHGSIQQKASRGINAGYSECLRN